jgi:diguanylate cyclase (GGDEF)-like protein/PAS domain S-box-containing protein
LRLWLPIFVFLAFALLLLLSALIQRERLMKQVDEAGTLIVTDVLESTARHFNSFQQHDEHKDYFASEIAAIGLNPSVDFIALVDQNGAVANASDLALNGLKATGHVSRFSDDSFNNVQQGKKLSLAFDSSGRKIVAYHAVELPKKADELRSNQIGTLFLVYDLSNEKSNVTQRLLRESILVWFAGITLMIFLEWALKRWLSNPLSYLIAVLGSLSKGDYSVRARMKGKGELGELARVFNLLVAELSATLSAIPDLIFELDRHGTYLKVFGGQEGLLAQSSHQLLGQRVSDVLEREAASIVMSAIAEADAYGRSQGSSFSMSLPQGETWFELSVAKKNTDGGKDGTFILISRDITSRMQAKLQIEESERLAKRALEDLRHQKFALDQHAIVAITDVRGDITYVNSKFCEISQFSKEELLGRNHRILNSGFHSKEYFTDMYRSIASGKVWKGEIRNRAKDGSYYWLATTIVPFLGEDGKPIQYIALRTDITETKASEEQIRQLAFYDSLTGLPNRRLLQDRLKQAMATSARSGSHGALMFLDLDHFKDINDTKGHETGDMLLVEVSTRIRKEVREGDTVARLGGDEFVVILESLSTELLEAVSQADVIAEKIRYAIGQVCRLTDQEFSVGTSIGISMFRNHEESINDLLKHADTAMYRAKNAGRNAVCFYDPAMQQSIEARTQLVYDMRIALRLKQFELYFQAQVGSVRNEQCHAAEVLLRWKHPERGFISPATFIPIAEESGLILQIGQWVMEAACAQLRTWQSMDGLREIKLSVNVSSKQFKQNDFVEKLVSLIECYAIDPTKLKLELTESLVIDDVDGCIRKMNELKGLGITFSMDDFGTGYSSLSYLKRLPLDQIKIDQSFVRDITSSKNDEAIVKAIIAIGDAMGVSVIAEGVETEAQLAFMEIHGCHEFQGYLFSKPVPLAEFESFLKQRS